MPNVNKPIPELTYKWTFQNFVEEIITLSEVVEVPGVKERRDALFQEVWKRFPKECKALGMTETLR